MFPLSPPPTQLHILKISACDGIMNSGPASLVGVRTTGSGQHWGPPLTASSGGPLPLRPGLGSGSGSGVQRTQEGKERTEDLGTEVQPAPLVPCILQ